MTSDEILLLQFRHGSREAFDELFARYRAPVYGFFRRRLERRSRAEDLTQETFLAVLRATDRYEPRSPMRSYLFGIAYKLLSAERRKSGRDSRIRRTQRLRITRSHRCGCARRWRNWTRRSATF